MPKLGAARIVTAVSGAPPASSGPPALSLSPSSERLRRGSGGVRVLDLQRRLVAAGFDCGPLDGRFGPLTEGAVRAFQRRRGLAVDGVVGPETGRALTAVDAFDGGARPDAPLLAPPPAQGASSGGLPRHASPFVNAVAPGAVDTMHRYGVPASVTLAQAVLESGWGESPLAKKANNLFGIKGRGPAGSVKVNTREYLDGTWQTVEASFRAYHTPAESIEDHGRLLSSSRYYREAMTKVEDPRAFARCMGAVYATDPKYADRLLGLIDRHGLDRFDVC